MAADDDLERLLREVEASLGEGNKPDPNAAAGATGGGQVSRRPGGRAAKGSGATPAKGGGASPAKGGGATPAKRDGEKALGKVGQSAVAGGVAAVAVFIAFALLPFLRAGSGAAGAFAGAFAAWLIATLLRR